MLQYSYERKNSDKVRTPCPRGGIRVANCKIYGIDELKTMISPIAAQYGVDRIFLFGSYARGQATEESDVDLRVDKGRLKGLFALGALYSDLEERLGKKLDLLTTGSLDQQFLNHIAAEEVLLYDCTQS